METPISKPPKSKHGQRWQRRIYDVPPNSSRDPKVGPKMKEWKKKKIGARSLTHNTSGVGGCDGAPRWD